MYTLSPVAVTTAIEQAVSRIEAMTPPCSALIAAWPRISGRVCRRSAIVPVAPLVELEAEPGIERSPVHARLQCLPGPLEGVGRAH